MRTPTVEDARSFIERTSFHWHQRWEIVPGVLGTPGANDISWLLNRVGFPADLTGMSVLDIGTTNGGAAFEAERRGAERVVAVDIFEPDRFGFSDLADFLDARVEYVQASVYELSSVLEEQFDVVLFLGVLYHLRHPLLALDEVRARTRGTMFLETAVCDGELGSAADAPLARFYRGGELGGDPSNWFAPTIRALVEWCRSCGFETAVVDGWPEDAPQRAAVRAHPSPGKPEWVTTTYERPLRMRVERPGGS